MALRAATRTHVAPVHPNAGVRAAYRRALSRLLGEMFEDVETQVTAAYRTTMGFDAGLRSLLRSLKKDWVGRFDSMSEEIAAMFAHGAGQHADLAFSAALSRAGFTVPFKPTIKMQAKLAGITRENVKRIKSIPQDFFADMHKTVFDSVRAGRKMAGLTEHLHQAYGVTRRRAAFISRDQNNKATAALHSLRAQELGLTTGVWQHTAASLHPREEHAGFSGREFDLKDGHDFDDGLGPVIPGQAYNCGCLWLTVVPGYNDEESQTEEKAS